MMPLTLPFVMPVLANLGYDPRLVGSHVCGFDRNRTRQPSIWIKFVYDSWSSSSIFRYVYSQELLAALRNDDFDGVDSDFLSEIGALVAKDPILNALEEKWDY